MLVHTHFITANFPCHTLAINDEFSLPIKTQNQSAINERYLCMSYPYALSQGPAMFFMLGCQSSETAFLHGTKNSCQQRVANIYTKDL